jgi:hypothetical protein
VTDEKRKHIIAMQQQGMRAMTPAQMEERAQKQAAGMRNIAHSQQHSGDDLRNM